MAIRDGGLPALQVGNRIWRNVDADTVTQPRFDESRGCRLFNAAYSFDRRGWFLSSGYGIVCFCFEEIPENWTYFRVERVDKNRAFVSPQVGSEQELIRRSYATSGGDRREPVSRAADYCLAR